MDRGDTDQPGEPSASRPGQYSSKEPTRSHVPQDRHHGFQHRCETLYLAQRRQPGVKFSPSPEAALLEHGSGGTPAALTHLLLLEYGGSKMILQAQERATRSKSGTPHTLDTGFPHRSAVRLGDGGGVTWVSAQDRRSAALKLPWETGPRQGQLCQQEGGNPSLPTFFPSASPTSTKIISADLAYRHPGFGPQVALQISDGLIAKPWKNTRQSPTPLPSCAWPDQAALFGV